MNELVWRTPAGGISIHSGPTDVGVVDVSAYSKIRVLARPHFYIAGDLKIYLKLTEGSDAFFIIDSLDLFAAGNHPTRVYDVPGSKLTIFAEAKFQSPQDAIPIDVVIYGR
jgi:hypothetical protein